MDNFLPFVHRLQRGMSQITLHIDIKSHENAKEPQISRGNQTSMPANNSMPILTTQSHSATKLKACEES